MKMKTSTQINKKRVAEGKPKLNFKLIRKVIKRIENTPETYAQQVFVDKVEQVQRAGSPQYMGTVGSLALFLRVEQLRALPEKQLSAPHQQ